MSRAAFLDRDGTIMADVPYLTDPGRVSLLPGVTDALRRLQESGFKLVVVSNQSLVARGLGTREDVQRVNDRLSEMLAAGGVHVDGVYYCPHGPGDGCDCRKPRPGMLFRAAEDLDIDLKSSVMFGDKDDDVQAGIRAGCGRSIRIHHAAGSHRESDDQSLREAVEFVLSQTSNDCS